jgi:Sigma-70 region 2
VRVRKGSLAELEALYRERYPVFLRVARATVRDDSAAADAVHDAFVQAVRNRRSFRGDGTLEAWVWRMVVNAARERCRDVGPRGGDLVEEPDERRNGFGDPVRAAVAARALAAADDGPVLHVVLRGEWGGTLVDLETGRQTPVHGENEIWYDPDRPLVRTISRLGESVQHERVYDPGEPPAELVALGREYRKALQSGSARVAGEGTIDGERVTWITIRSKMLPDSADGKFHEWVQQVAVSHETFRPIATRDTRDGRPGPGTLQRVLS